MSKSRQISIFLATLTLGFALCTSAIKINMSQLIKVVTRRSGRRYPFITAGSFTANPFSRYSEGLYPPRSPCPVIARTRGGGEGEYTPYPRISVLTPSLYVASPDWMPSTKSTTQRQARPLIFRRGSFLTMTQVEHVTEID